MQEPFQSDLRRLYAKIAEFTTESQTFYSVLKNRSDMKTQRAIDSFLELCLIPISPESRLAAILRIVNLQEEALIQLLKKAGRSEEEIHKIRLLAYEWVADYHLRQHSLLLEWVEDNALFTPFYRAVLHGVHDVGLAFTKWNPKWMNHLLFTLNPSLKKQFESDENVLSYLHEHDLFDKGHGGGEPGDRSYSVLTAENDGYAVKAYGEAFPEVQEIIRALQSFKESLTPLEDSVFDQKEAYLNYLDSLITAFSEKKTDSLIPRWADVDRAWMDLTAPFQIGHPLEYYEDKYRMAVAPEWDLRIQDPDSLQSESLVGTIGNMVAKISDSIDSPDKQSIVERFTRNLHDVQLYISRPGLYYGSEFNGLFSAQVVPNDEIVSKERGKKIFAFPDRVLQMYRAKPFLKIDSDFYGIDFLHRYKQLVFLNEKAWKEVYEVTTIGHEYGHILWMDDDSEMRMNASGQYKNLEEFKATSGGLVAFFTRPDHDLLPCVLTEHVKRCVSLISWMESNDTQPYYCEALIHLKGLFDSGVLDFDPDSGKITVSFSSASTHGVCGWYRETYRKLAAHYLSKKDSKQFLADFIMHDGTHFLPVDEHVRNFVTHYWHKYREMGHELDPGDSNDKWLAKAQEPA